MTDIGTRIDVSVTRRGTLVLLADGASAEEGLEVSIGGGLLEVRDSRGAIARAALTTEAAHALGGRRAASVVLVGADGTERFHGAEIRGRD